jgi:hypothetical protein
VFFKHFPNNTSKYVLPDNQKTIGFRDVDTGRVYVYGIVTAARNEYERYIGNSWYEFKNLKNAMAGDVLKCILDNPPDIMNVEVVRMRGRRF